MATNQKLNKAMQAKNDEFYTRKADIEVEIQAYLEFNPSLFVGKIILCPCDDPTWSNFTAYFVENFEKLGLKELISTCYVQNGKGKILRKTARNTDLAFLNGDGDFRSDELVSLRDQADFIVTNPPFSLFRDFIAWIMDGKKQFAVICNKNCVTFKEVFPKIKANEIWSGYRSWAGGMWFETIDENDVDKVENGVKLKNVSSIWLTNIEHNRRYDPIALYEKEENLLKYPSLKEKNAYIKYDNYDAIEIPLTKAIPRNYKGIMGVPISFLDKFNPCQFELIGATESEGKGFSNGLWISSSGIAQACVNQQRVYKRVFVRAR
ncbi:adenine-specific methyltransferase EcoRI family protein [Campylobacter sp. RM16187]|uniref:adenine-specific methyltransferase EcoRI family protein n=1 Tax=Campylobacter sp. RM16187 TaxID=1660063 RepID=UPI0021B6B5D0|nr:adenine-specific methyltransferase EcoRI family protein [Campylobacter sp. RM16187]QKG30270.1 EcoRI methylase family protein [Campylobacter sp. RM16187]